LPCDQAHGMSRRIRAAERRIIDKVGAQQAGKRAYKVPEI
jgi:hypothetical protein